MKLVVAVCVRILHSHPGAELHMGSDRLPERLVVRHAGKVEGSHVELDEPLALLLGDAESSVNIDQMSESEFPREAVRSAEGLGSEGGEVVDVLRPATAEERLEDLVCQDARIEDVL